MKELLQQYGVPSVGVLPYPFFVFVGNMLLLLASTLVLARVYRGGTGLSNDRRTFSGNFVPLGLSTMMIIAIVQSSLALSLGLVGALSIVRFRAAIKEPEELTFLFLTIGLGVGFGANQPAVTLTVFTVLMVLLTLRNRREGAGETLSYWLSVDGPPEAEAGGLRGWLREQGVDSRLVTRQWQAGADSQLWELHDCSTAQADGLIDALRADYPDAQVKLTVRPADYL